MNIVYAVVVCLLVLVSVAWMILARMEMRRMNTLIEGYRRAVRTFLSASGNDLCHDNRRDLARAFDCFDRVASVPVGPQEFAEGCRAYQHSIYGRAPGDDALLEAAELLASLATAKDYQVGPAKREAITLFLQKHALLLRGAVQRSGRK